MGNNNSELKEIKIYLDEETKEQLQRMAKEKNQSLKTFISDKLVQFCDIFCLSQLYKS